MSKEERKTFWLMVADFLHKLVFWKHEKKTPQDGNR